MTQSYTLTQAMQGSTLYKPCKMPHECILILIKMILEGHFSGLYSKILSPLTKVGEGTFQDFSFGGNSDENNIKNVYGALKLAI